MPRAYNFSAGPAALPELVLERLASQLQDFEGLGLSVMEMSHRSAPFASILATAKERLVRLLDIPSNYEILFLQGGATLMFSAIPLNFMKGGKAAYVISGNFSKKAWQEAQKYGEAICIASSEDSGHTKVPQIPAVDQDFDYLHICLNNTIYGTQFHELPDTGSVPLIADVSSCFLAEPLDISRFGAVYAGVQKNAGIGGLVICIVRKDLLEAAPARSDICPSYLNFQLQAAQNSLYNTPNCWAIQVSSEVFRWLEEEGGLAAIAAKNHAKTDKLYHVIDSSNYYLCPVEPASRSIANVRFTTQDPDLDARFCEAAAAANILNIKGHRLIGGMRASCYNAVPEAWVDYLISFMQDFAEKNPRS